MPTGTGGGEKEQKSSLLQTLVRRTVLFLFLLSLTGLFCYAAGLKQGLQDTTLLKLLVVFRIIGQLLAFFSIIAALFSIWNFVGSIPHKQAGYRLPALAGMVFFPLSFFWGIALVLLPSIITVITGGNG